ncbi:MAG: cell wall hydrolase [Clostridia bacterium]|nr:cell wall hydrolase [Clostridia bacterium]
MTRVKRLVAITVLACAVTVAFAWNRLPGADAQGRGGSGDLLARLVTAEAEGEPYQGMVAVAAVLLNRVESSKFPNTVPGVVFQPAAFESVSNGLIWRRSPSNQARSAARDALNGVDPTYGCLFFWNPSKPVSGWIWGRGIAVRIGKHVFAR